MIVRGEQDGGRGDVAGRAQLNGAAHLVLFDEPLHVCAPASSYVRGCAHTIRRCAHYRGKRTRLGARSSMTKRTALAQKSGSLAMHSALYPASVSGTL